MRSLFMLLFCAGAWCCFSQSTTVNFANYVPGGVGGPIVDAPVRDASGQLCVGCSAQLYVGPANTTDASSLVTNGISGGPAPFSPGQPGYFQGGNRTISGFPAGSTVTFQVRAWAASSGASWASATERGESNLIQVTLPGSGSVNLVGLQPFNLSIIPEPSVWSLAIIGLLAAKVTRRRWRRM